MAKQLQLRRGTTSQHSTFTGANGEVTIDTDKKVVVVHDGTTVGGFPLAKQTSVDSKVTKVTSTDNAIVRFNGVTGDVQNSGVIIDDNGNVGIGITPSAWTTYKSLELGAGNGIHASNGIGQELHISNNAYYNSGYKYALNYYATDYTQNAGNHIWRTAPSGIAGNAITWTNAMILDASANLLVSSSLGVGYNGSSYSSYPQSVSVYHSNSNNYTQIVSRNVADSSSVFYSAIGGVVKAGILANGSFQSATNSYGSTSDAKLKENVVETSDKLDKLMNVRVVNFNYIGDDQKQIGVIAQEIEKIFPSIVFETKDTKQVEVEKEDGTIEFETVETGEVTKNVKYSVIYMMMLKGMQEQQAIINDLKARIEVLEAK